jgi:hypothetical protein
LDTSGFEKKIKNNMVEKKRLDGNGEKWQEMNSDWWTMLHKGSEEESERPGGLDREGKLYRELDKLYPAEQHTHGNKGAWFREENRSDLIRKYFEDKDCPFFMADDGGKFTVENNGEDRGASAVVLWAPYMALDETFEDIIDIWHTRKAVPFAVRVGCVPNKLGTETTNCGHTELRALNCDLEMLRVNDPCLHILDSNAIAFAARAIRDDPTPTMRRRVRGTGVAAGKGDLERCRDNMNEWSKEVVEGDDRETWNRRQWKNLATIQKQIKGWKIGNWPTTYRDDKATKNPILLVDSHQLEDNGRLSGRYKQVTPCEAFVSANELADKICSVTLGLEKEEQGNLILSTLETPSDIRYPPTPSDLHSHI